MNELITDRTQADVDRQLYLDGLWDPYLRRFLGTDAERAEWLAGTKGAYKASDLNRVGEATEYIAERLQAAGYAVEIHPHTKWQDADWVTSGVASKLLADLRALRSCFAQAAGTPAVPEDLELFTVEDANNVEKILAAVDRLLSNLMAAWYFSGEIHSGEV